jgi:S-adenosylmethionine/arginine decarboxylase-like enzyme
MPILEHKHLIVRANLRKPPVSTTEIIPWMENLVRKIGMKIMMGPYAAYSDMPGNRGLTAVTIIETSHIALHVWDEVDPALMQLDVYTCSTLNPKDVFDAFQCFLPVNFEYKFIDREHELTLLDRGRINEILSIST